MLHLLYILAFTILALIAVSNLIRNLIVFSVEGDGVYSKGQSSNARGRYGSKVVRSVPHPEFLDSTGNIIKDPLLVMRSIDVQDARAHLDALYEASPGYSGEIDKEN
ncbi:DUF2973 domain-containing protein [Chlorogloea sp. CCALA 695]|uniref:DUF2973 domain-containing protein n=1 Tax=Chlorogloea sp. CCALA 695 TaxID=2107693 RepID=UPI000D071A1F|nr:DUF2973 domain-containing protein [Chlorogloea sp. CCALA 695]PSB31755.1 DUF2973 domain-containing protein [Chlorogloea sp. CCALA 695]